MNTQDASTWVESLPTKKGQSAELISGYREDYEKKPPKVHYDLLFGGTDLAKRIDHSAFESLHLDKGVLREKYFMEWPHTNYAIVARDLKKIHTKLPHELIGFDRSGVGDAAIELFDRSFIPLTPIVTTMNMKIDIIHIVRTLFQKGYLLVDRESETSNKGTDDLPTQIEEQEEIVSKAGNMLYQHPPKKHDDRFWALGYACYVALPFLMNKAPIAIKQGVDQMYNMGPRDVDAEINAIMGINPGARGFW